MNNEFDLEQQRPRVNPVSPAPVMSPASPLDNLNVTNQNNPSIGQNPNKPKPSTNSADSAKPIRTYESDVAEVLSHKKTSTASIAIAESKRNDEHEFIGNNIKNDETNIESNTDAPKKSILKIVLIVFSIILIGGGIAGGYYFYSQSALVPVKRVTINPETQTKTLIPASAHTVIAIDNKSLKEIVNSLKIALNKPQTSGNINEIILTEMIDQKNYRVSIAKMLKIMNISPPDILVRSLDETPMLGISKNSNGTKGFFMIGQINYYQNAFAGMLQWEKFMPDDLKDYLYQNVPQDITTAPIVNIPLSDNNATNTTTTTQTNYTNPSLVIHGSFFDRIIKNKDVREFIDTDGNIRLVYSFVDNTRLVIADSEATLTTILTTLEQQAYVR